jgi:uncharacterized protein
MPVVPTYPGVYIQEIPSGVRTITGVSTSVTAFIGYTQRGGVNRARQIFNYGDYERAFGGLHLDSPVSYAVAQFFQNGGSEAWIVRAAQGAAAATVTLRNSVAGTDPVLAVAAASEGLWGNNLRLDVDYDTANPASLFNLTVTELEERNGALQVARVEKHRNLSMDSRAPTFVVDTINADSNLIRVERSAGAAALVTGNGTSTSGDLDGFDFTQLDDNHRRLAITVDGDGPHEFDIFDAGGSIGGASQNTRLNNLASQIQTRVRAIKPAFNAFACARSGTRIVCTSPTTGEHSSVRLSNATIRNAASLLRLGLANGGTEAEAAAAIRPARTGTVSNDLSAVDLSALPAAATMNVTIQASGLPDDGPHTLALWSSAAERPDNLPALRSRLLAALNASDRAELSGAAVNLHDNQLQIMAGGSNPNARLTFADDAAAGEVADDLRLSATGTGAVNVAHYAVGSAVTSAGQEGGVGGNDGTPPGATELRGSRDAKTGIYALEDVDIFNILCLPGVTESAVLGEAITYAEERRAFAILDLPAQVDTLDEARQWLTDNASLRHKNAAAYFPQIRVPDPLQNFRLRSFPPSGAIAGLYARTDAERGVWKAPAGTDAAIRGVRELAYTLTDQENGALNPLGLNAIRNFPVYGIVAWGARTLVGADQMASEWKYIPVRRLALYLEESLYRGTQWVVFEPNDEPLWAQIRLNVGAFMQSLFRQGAFQGRTPQEAYFVKCDSETTTQDDINRGIVNIVVGFAPLKPAEFVIISLQQMAGQLEAA